jgi:hypothetical protein
MRAALRVRQHKSYAHEKERSVTRFLKRAGERHPLFGIPLLSIPKDVTQHRSQHACLTDRVVGLGMLHEVDHEHADRVQRRDGLPARACCHNARVPRGLVCAGKEIRSDVLRARRDLAHTRVRRAGAERRAARTRESERVAGVCRERERVAERPVRAARCVAVGCKHLNERCRGASVRRETGSVVSPLVRGGCLGRRDKQVIDA